MPNTQLAKSFLFRYFQKNSLWDDQLTGAVNKRDIPDDDKMVEALTLLIDRFDQWASSPQDKIDLVYQQIKSFQDVSPESYRNKIGVAYLIPAESDATQIILGAFKEYINSADAFRVNRTHHRKSYLFSAVTYDWLSTDIKNLNHFLDQYLKPLPIKPLSVTQFLMNIIFGIMRAVQQLALYILLNPSFMFELFILLRLIPVVRTQPSDVMSNSSSLTQANHSSIAIHDAFFQPTTLIDSAHNFAFKADMREYEYNIQSGWVANLASANLEKLVAAKTLISDDMVAEYRSNNDTLSDFKTKFVTIVRQIYESSSLNKLKINSLLFTNFQFILKPSVAFIESASTPALLKISFYMQYDPQINKLALSIDFPHVVQFKAMLMHHINMAWRSLNNCFIQQNIEHHEKKRYALSFPYNIHVPQDKKLYNKRFCSQQ